jgi:hypothetical protein
MMNPHIEAAFRLLIQKGLLQFLQHFPPKKVQKVKDIQPPFLCYAIGANQILQPRQSGFLFFVGASQPPGRTLLEFLE